MRSKSKKSTTKGRMAGRARVSVTPTLVLSGPIISAGSRDAAITEIQKNCKFSTNWAGTSEITSLSTFFQLIDFGLGTPYEYWFRGLSKALDYDLVPSALRFNGSDTRKTALESIKEVARSLTNKISNPPLLTDLFGWAQVAQHYGYPTRLLDWSRSPVAALYFACSKHQDKPGLVVCMNPASLNTTSKRGQKILDQSDVDLNGYFKLGPDQRKRGLPNIAIHSNNNADRILAQHGSFTIHGARNFGIDKSQAPGLIAFPVMPDHKSKILRQLDTIGIGEMYLFPEAEHVCNYLRVKHGLET